MKDVPIGSAINDFKGTPLKAAGDELVSLGFIALNQLGKYISRAGDEQTKTWHLGVKLQEAVATGQFNLQLEDAEFEHLKKVCEQNSAGYVDLIMGQICPMLQALSGKQRAEK